MVATQELLNVARSQLGVTEIPFGSNQVLYASWAGIPGQAWCGAFVCWCLEKVGVLDIPKFVWTPSGAQSYQNAGRWDHTPSIGDVVFFTWPEVGRICHVGFVEALREDGGVVTIEGNTDERGGGTGGKVMRHVRRASMTGFGRPIYTALTLPTPQAPAIPVAVAARPMIKQGSRGPNVKYLQQKLGITADGIFGPQTKARVMQWQRNHNLIADGIVGPRTWATVG